MSLSREMSRRHEQDVADWFGTTPSRGSGNQHNNPMDGRILHINNPMGFAWDCKATRSASIGVSLPMWEKAIDQSHGERPLIPLRFYGDDRLRIIRADLVVLNLHDLLEMNSMIADVAV